MNMAMEIEFSENVEPTITNSSSKSCDINVFIIEKELDGEYIAIITIAAVCLVAGFFLGLTGNVHH